MTKYIYKYNPDTFEYTEKQEAYLDPEETKIQGKNIYMLPAWASFIGPPKPKKNQVILFDTLNDSWDVIPDYRGMYKVDSNMQPELITCWGELEEGYVAITKEQALIIFADDLYYIIQDGQLVKNPNYEAQSLERAKQNKYNEALTGAKNFIDNDAVYQFDENNSIEATDGNIGKITAYALAFQTGTVEFVEWTSKEDNVLTLAAEDVLRILTGLGEIQSNVWNTQFVNYKNQIEQAVSIEDVERIVINYGR